MRPWLTFTLAPSTQCSKPAFGRLTGKLQPHLMCFGLFYCFHDISAGFRPVISGHRQESEASQLAMRPAIYPRPSHPRPRSLALQFLGYVLPKAPQFQCAGARAAASPPERMPPTSNASQMPSPMSKAACPLLRSGSIPRAFRVQYPLDSEPAQNNTPFLLSYPGIATTAS